MLELDSFGVEPVPRVAGQAGVIESGLAPRCVERVARKGVIGVTSPLDLLDDVNADDVQAAVEASRALDQP